MFNAKEYYNSPFVAGNWMKGVKAGELVLHLQQLRKRHENRAFRQPYETTAAALMLLLDQSDASFNELFTGMQKVLEESSAAQVRITELEEEVKNLKKKLADALTKEESNAAVQRKVEKPIQERPAVNPASSGGQKAKTK